MALTRTTISAAVSADALIIPVTSASGFAAGNFLRVDNEFMQVVSVSGSNVSVRSRGDFGSAAVAHNILAPATTGLTSDLPDFPVGQVAQVDPNGQTIVTASVDGALSIPNQNTLVLVQKAGVCAMTLAGKRYVFVSVFDGAQPARKARARSVVVALNVSGAA